MPSPQCPTNRHIHWLSKKGDLLFPILKSISLFSLFKWILHNQIMWQLVTLIIECQFGKWDSLRIYTWHIWTLRLFLVKIIGSMFLYKVCRPRVVNLNKKNRAELCQAQGKFSLVYFEFLSSWFLPGWLGPKPITIV